MIRFIIKKKWLNGMSGAQGETLSTLDADVPQLQEILEASGSGEMMYEFSELVGVEIRPPEAT